MALKRIDNAFAKAGQRAALIPYITTGDPSPQATLALMHSLAEAGADIIELGVPFSDPMADGPVIQRAAERAIAKGVGLPRVLELVAEFRKLNNETPVVLMGYANPIEAMGRAIFAEKAGAAGVDGVLVVDYPPEEFDEFTGLLKAQGISPIFLLAPTSTEERIKTVGNIAEGYVYYVSLRGVTGSGALDIEDVQQRVLAIKKHVKIPVGVGFGIRDAESAAKIAQVADAVVIGSKIIETMEQAIVGKPEDQVTDVAVASASTWLKGVREALDKVQNKDK
ncbi:tryptophan synthase subunit alpha [Advenella sp. WQ 585]|uniref:Tryptophan synthase alpha chain n=2 Tax=Advenella mandrilli TaxID=2800330 RepID=A0ABS1EFK1_9BURK|nr:tryptophan synthase subunit alpha [Advenella mandrilli]MBK1780972.1 tryptophan synthase subunit alpha [Advenella mandrilli]